MKQDVLHRMPELGNASELAALVSEYRPLRALGTGINNRLVGRLSRDMVEEGAEKLGLFNDGTLVFTEDRMSVLMDYCIHDVYRDGRNTVDQYLLDSPPPENSDEWPYLRAMQGAVYSAFKVESVIPDVGVVAENIISGRSVLIVDLGMGQSMVPDVFFASRLLSFDNFSVTGGAPIPLGVIRENTSEANVKETLAKVSNDGEGLTDPGNLIRASMERRADEQIAYRDPNGSTIHGGQRTLYKPHSKIGRNAPCPCGSGEKYKRCCLKKAKR